MNLEASIRLACWASQVPSFLLPGSSLPEIDGNKTQQERLENGEKESQLNKYSRPHILVCKLGGKQNEHQHILKYEMTGIFTKQVISKIKGLLN